LVVDCVLLNTDLALDDLALQLREVLALPNENASGLSQKRYGVNRGGDYYLFETLGLEVFLMKNCGETQLSDDPAWRYHLTLDTSVSGIPYDQDLWDKLLSHIARVLTVLGMRVQTMESAF
jgi:hypothetical protein